MSISVCILTLDEGHNLPGALNSVQSICDDVVVFDSFSSDRTCSIARDAGARVFQRRFDDYARQRRAALHEVTYKHSWVLMLDADERVETDLWEEMIGKVRRAPPETTLFRLRRRDYLWGTWIQ